MSSSGPKEPGSTPRPYPPSDAAASLTGRFVGRETERALLLARLDATLAGRGSLVLLTGEPGIGKTRICEELENAANLRGVPVAWGRCWESGGARPYWPWVQVLRFCALHRGADELKAAAGEGADSMASLMPELFGSEPRGERTQLPVTEQRDSASERFALFVGIADVLRSFAARTPFVIVLDDIHSADSDSLLLTKFIARDLRQVPILLVVTYRDADVRLTPAVADPIAELSREGVNLTLRGLNPAQVREFVELSIGVPPSEPLVQELYRATDGNLLFLAEIARELDSDAATANAETARELAAHIPHGIRAAIRTRLHQLPDSARDFLLTAAVVGPRFDLRAVTEVSGAGSREAATALEEGTRQGLVNRADGTPGSYRFTHELVAEVLYDGIPVDLRQTLHHRIAEYFEQSHSSDPAGTHATLLHHYLRASPAASESAVFYARKAADDSARILAYSEAARLYEMALRALEEHRSPDLLQRCELLLALGEAQCRASDYSHFRPTFLEAARIARSLSSPEHLAKAALGYGMLGNAMSPGLADPDPVAKGLLEEALEALQPTDHPLRARLLARLAEEIGATAPRDRLTALIDEAVRLAGARGDAEAQADALYIKFRALVRGPDHPAQSKALLEEIREIAERNRMQHWGSRLHYHLGAIALEAGDIAGVYEQIAMLNAIPEALHRASPGQIAEITLIVSAMCALIEGRFEDAARTSTEALRTGRRRKHPEAEAFFGLQMVSVYREQGRLAEIIEPTMRNLANDPQNTLVRAILAFAYAAVGRIDDAGVEFSRLAADEFRRVRRDFAWLGSMAYSSETCAAIGDRANAAVLTGLLAPMADRNVAIGFFCYLGPVAYYLGVLAAVLGNLDDAVRHFETAIESAQRLGASGWIARIQLRLARTLVERSHTGDQALARDYVGRAHTTAAVLGAKDLLDTVADISSRLAAPQQPAPGSKTAPRLRVVFHKEGDYWTISHGGRVFRLKDAKGMGYIARLLGNPGAEVHALDLMSGGAFAAPAEDAADDRNFRLAHDEEDEDQSGEPDDLHLVAADDAGEILDPQAKASYQRRLNELRQKLDDAKEFGNAERAAEIHEEIDALAQELRRAIGIGGRHRRFGSASERARLNVTRAIKTAIERIDENDSELGALLSKTIRTGIFCSYTPDPSQPFSWEL